MAFYLSRAGLAVSWVARHLFGRAATVTLTIVIVIYTLGILVFQQAQYAYRSSRPRALEDQRTRHLPLGSVLTMPDPRLDSMLGHGWYGVEADGLRWSAGMSSVLSLPPREPDMDLSLTLRLLAASDGEHSSNRVLVHLHGHEVARLDVAVDQSRNYQVALPSSLHQGYPILLILSYEYSVQPNFTDLRDIAVRLLELRLDPKAGGS